MQPKTKKSYDALITAKVWTKSDCQRVVNALNRMRFEHGKDRTEAYNFMNDWRDRFNSTDREYKITADHSDRGINYLRNYCFTTKGITRKSCQLGYFEQDVVKNFSHFTFVGFYTEYGNYFDYYRIVYRCYDKFGRYFDYCPMHWGHPLVVNISDRITKRLNQYLKRA